MPGLIVVPIALALANWYGLYVGARKLEYIFKPATLTALIVWTIWLATARPGGWTWLAVWFVVGLFFSLGGDVCLMMPDQKRYFLPGLVSFLIAHVAYIAGMNGTPPPAVALLLLVPAGLLWALVFGGIAGGLREHGQARLLGPVAVYSVVLSLMLGSAWATAFRPDWSLAARALAIAGGTLFFVSDSMLAWNLFVRPWPRGRLYVRVTYHLAQFCLAAVVAWAPVVTMSVD